MDPHSELELKFDAQKVDSRHLSTFMSYISSDLLTEHKDVYIESYVKVCGIDVFYGRGKSIVRFRSDGGNRHELTFKKRKSAKSITDRVEINLKLGNDTQSNTVDAFFENLGFKEIFWLSKVSGIFHVKGRIDVGNRKEFYSATIALYDVLKDTKHSRRFLEIEIESFSECSKKAARKALDFWSKMLQKEFGLEKPLNASLFEIYSKL